MKATVAITTDDCSVLGAMLDGISATATDRTVLLQIDDDGIRVIVGHETTVALGTRIDL